MQMDVSGKKAIVTGSSEGIGLAVARQLACAGAQVVLNGRRKAAVDAAVERVCRESRRDAALGFVGDLGDAEGCKALVAAHPSCEVLVNNLGLYGPQDFFETPDSEWTRYFETNVMSGVRLARAYLPRMMEQGWGRVVFVSSESALNIPGDMIHYGFSKTAQLAVARGLAKRVAGSGVTVNSVLPGPTLSEGLREMLASEAEKQGKSLEEVAKQFVMENRPSSVIQRAASVEEVANLITYVCSPLSSATSGAALRVDGGVVDSL